MGTVMAVTRTAMTVVEYVRRRSKGERDMPEHDGMMP
jgi:Na+/H+-translocating membrane pyrophosphatase